MALLTELQDLSGRARDAAQQRFNAGSVARLEVLQAQLALADLVNYQEAVGRDLPILLLPTMVEAADRKAVEQAGLLAQAVGRAYGGPGFTFLPAVKRAATVRASEMRHGLLSAVPAKDTPEVVAQYRAVAAIVADAGAATGC